MALFLFQKDLDVLIKYFHVFPLRLLPRLTNYSNKIGEQEGTVILDKS